MKRLAGMAPARIASVLALVAAVAIPWYGWVAAGAAVFLVLLGAVLAPRVEMPHRGRLRLLAGAIQRRFLRSPWRPKRP